MTYTCEWATKRATGSIDIEAANVTAAKKEARAKLRDGYGLKAVIVSAKPFKAGRARGPKAE